MSLSRLDGIPGLNPDAALLQMAIARLESVWMRDDYGVTALAPLDLLATGCPHRHVLHAIAGAQDLAVCCCSYCYAGTLLCHARQAEIGALVPVVGFVAAHVIARGIRWIVVDVVLDEARLANLAGYWKLKLKRHCRSH
jgi:hypothetical protein